MARFAGLGILTGGRSYDPPKIDIDMMREILGSLQAAAVTEYVVGFVPEEGNGTPKKHKLEVKMASSNGVKLSGGKRTIVH